MSMSGSYDRDTELSQTDLSKCPLDVRWECELLEMFTLKHPCNMTLTNQHLLYQECQSKHYYKTSVLCLIDKLWISLTFLRVFRLFNQM